LFPWNCAFELERVIGNELNYCFSASQHNRRGEGDVAERDAPVVAERAPACMVALNDLVVSVPRSQ
jgi:hypothetical protein